MKSFCQVYNFDNLLDNPTYYKNPTNSSCVDLIITNKSRCFQNSWKFETGQNDSNSTKIIFCKTEAKSTILPQLQILQQYSF